MAKKSDASLARIVDLVPYISTHQGVSLLELSQVFQCSVKEIESDLWTLIDCGLPNYSPLENMQLDFEDGHVTISNAKELSRIRKLTKLEIVTLLVGLQAIADVYQDQVLLDLIARLTREISSKNVPEFEEKHEKLSEAIANNEIVEIEYLVLERDEITKREILPLSMYGDNGRVYIRSFCFLSNSARTFRLDRIRSVKETGRSDLSHIPDEAATNSGSVKINITKRKRLVREYFKIEDENSVKFFNANWLVKSVLSFAGVVEIRENQELRSEIALKASAALSLYD